MQLSYQRNPPVARAGMLAEALGTYPRIVSRICRGLVQAGRAVFRVPGFGGPSAGIDSGECYQAPTPGIAVNTTAILASGGASSASTQTVSGVALNGTVGGTEMQPARKVTLILSSHANWDATTAILTYINELNQLVTENLAIPDAGNVTLTTSGYVKQVISLYIPAQSGTSGTFTLGVAVLDTVDAADFEGIAHYEPIKEVASQAANAEYGDGDALGVVQFAPGGVWCIAEVAMAVTDSVYVRVGAGTFSTLGTIRNDNDSSSAVQLTSAKVRDYDAATGLVKISF